MSEQLPSNPLGDLHDVNVIADERLRQAARRLKRANEELEDAEREHSRAAAIVEALEKARG